MTSDKVTVNSSGVHYFLSAIPFAAAINIDKQVAHLSSYTIRCRFSSSFFEMLLLIVIVQN